VEEYGYDDGFYVSLSVKKTRTDVVLICPMCSRRIPKFKSWCDDRIDRENRQSGFP